MSNCYDFTSAQLREITGPGVYMIWHYDELFYVGASRNGFSRCFSQSHRCAHLLKSPRASLTFHPTQSTEEAFALENDLIDALKPKHNAITMRERLRRIKARERDFRADFKFNDKVKNEYRLLKRFYIREFKPNFPDLKIVIVGKMPVLHLCTVNNREVYYSRDKDRFVSLSLGQTPDWSQVFESPEPAGLYT